MFLLFDCKPWNAPFKEAASTKRFRGSMKTRGRTENISSRGPSNRKGKRRAPTPVGWKRTRRLQTLIPHVFLSSGRHRRGKSVSDDAKRRSAVWIWILSHNEHRRRMSSTVGMAREVEMERFHWWEAVGGWELRRQQLALCKPPLIRSLRTRAEEQEIWI